MSDEDKAALKAQLVPAMLALSAHSDRGLRAQIAETVTIVAKYDFPHDWPDLMDVSSFSLCFDFVWRKWALPLGKVWWP